MAEKECKYCASIILKKAKICPYCRKRQKWSLLTKIGLGIIVFIVVIGIIPKFFGPLLPQKFTEEQKKAAQESRDILIYTFIREGVFKELKREGKLQVVYVDGALWRSLLTYERKNELLRQISIFNEVSGYTPWVEIRNYRSGEVYGAFTPLRASRIYK